jgi:molecular chaperone HscB
MEPATSAHERCWHCGSPVDGPLVCDHCHTPQPLPAGSDSYRVLGLARSLALDPADLERRYHSAARAVHPDRHQSSDARAQQLSVAASAAVNRAYRTLRDPVARGKYWLELHGIRLNADNRVPPSLAALVFDTQEQLEDLRAAPDAAAARAAVEATRAGLEQRLADLLIALAGQFTGWPTTAAAAPAALAELQRHLAEINYLRTLLGDVEDTLGEPRGTDRRH